MRALIAGAGIAGLALALRLRGAGWDVVIVEIADGPRDEGYMVDFFGLGYEAAGRLGLLERLREIHYSIDELVYVDGAGRRRFGIPYPALRRRLFEGCHFNFLRGDLERVLRDELGESPPIRWGARVSAIDQDHDGVEVVLSDGSADRVELLIGADGVHSKVRELVFGPESKFEVPLGHRTAASILDRVPAGVDERDFTMLTAPGRMVAVYPIRGGRAATFFVHRTNLERGPEEPLETMRHVYGGLGWLVPELLERSDGASLYYDRVTQIRIDSWTSGRVTLCGDAAWCVSLMAGQGASLALAGAERLGAALDWAGTDVEGALARWEGELRPHLATRLDAGRSTAGWFVPEKRWRMAVRDLAMRTAAMPVLSRLARRQIGIGRAGR